MRILDKSKIYKGIKKYKKLDLFQKSLVVLPLIVLGFSMSACTETLQSLTPAASEQEARRKSGYPEFTERFMAKMPQLEQGKFFGPSEVSFRTWGMTYRVEEFTKNYNSQKSLNALVNEYLLSDIATQNSVFKAFIDTANELGLQVKKYLPGIWNTINLKFHEDKGNSKFYNGIDYVWIAYDENNNIKVIFTYEHNFFFASMQTLHDAMWATIYYGSSAVRVQHRLNNEVVDKYVVR